MIEETVEVKVVVYVWPFAPPEVVTSPTLKLAHVTLPEPDNVPVTFVALICGNVKEAVTVSVTEELIDKVEPFPIVMALHVRFPSTVRVNPAPIMISSVVAGMVPPGQGALGVVELQSPFPAVVIVAASLL